MSSESGVLDGDDPQIPPPLEGHDKTDTEDFPVSGQPCNDGDVIVASTHSQTPSVVQGFPTTPDFSVMTAVDDQLGSSFLAASYEGPLPPPAYLKGYNDLVPGAAETIISWVNDESVHRRSVELAENQHRRELEKRESEHRMRLEDKGMELGERALDAGIFRANMGMFLAWPLMIGIVSLGGYLIHEGKGGYGITLVESGLAIVVGAYVFKQAERFIGLGKRSSREGEQEKSAAEEPSPSKPE